MEFSALGLNLLKSFEGLSLTPYRDSAGKMTIGRGHLIKPGEYFKLITLGQADSLLSDDCYETVLSLNLMISVPLSQNQFDALVCLAFNIGVNAFFDSTLLKKLNAGDYAGAAQQFDVWNKVTVNGALTVSKGLTARRAREKSLFLSNPNATKTDVG